MGRLGGWLGMSARIRLEIHTHKLTSKQDGSRDGPTETVVSINTKDGRL